MPQRAEAIRRTVICSDGPTITGRQILVGVKTKAHEIVLRTHRCAVGIGRAERVGGILDQRDIGRQYRPDPIDIGGNTTKVNDDHRLRSRREFRFDVGCGRA